MIQVIDKHGSVTGPTLFFVAEMIVGNYMLLNLFLAILLKFISEGDEDEEANEKDKLQSQKTLAPGAVSGKGDVNEND